MPSQLALQARFSIPSGVMVNTFWFSDQNRTYAEMSAAAVSAVTQFYCANTANGPAGSIGGYMAGWVARPFEMRTYDYSLPKPRVPTIYSATLPNASSVSTSWRIPQDVAVCLSYHAAPPVTRRKRGRIYLGGCQTEWIGGGTAPGDPPVVSTALSLCIRQAAAILAAPTTGWVIRSVASGPSYFQITGGYVDSEPDTQRRRGNKTVIKTAWGS